MSASLTLGTAGHIDHGKTRLVEALTGTDTDRLPEEKRRGISIALGYAELELPGGTHLSLIDVPGHERFVRTMVAGATGIDLFLLAVDAGEGPKPQTREHVEILRLLGVAEGVVALTKTDAVDAAAQDAAEAATRELLPDHEIVRVSALDGRGLPELVAAIGRAAAAVKERRGDGPARLYVDRVFSLPGAGTVVTGTLWSGSIAAGDRLEILPAGFEVRVRSVEVHGAGVERAEAGRRVALGVSSERRRRPAPGDALVAPGAFRASYRLDVSLAEGFLVSARGQVTVCHGTSAVPARLLRVGERFAQLRLSQPLVTAAGDRLVLRQQATVGGGRILDPAPPRQLDEIRLELLERGELNGLLGAPLALETLRTRFGLGGAELEEALGESVRTGSWVCSRAWLEQTRDRARATLIAREGELDPGLAVGLLLGREPWAAEIAKLLALDLHEGKLYLPGRRPDSGARSGPIEQALAAAGLDAFPVADGTLARQLEREGRLVVLGDGLALAPAAYAQLREILVAECDQAQTISLARFRDLSGLSRRIAQLVLERFDVDRVTLRVGDVRRLRRGARSSPGSFSDGAAGPGGPAGLQSRSGRVTHG